MDFISTSRFAGGIGHSPERAAPVDGRNGPASRSHTKVNIFSSLFDESMRSPSGSVWSMTATPNRNGPYTPFSDGMGTPCGIDFEPIEARMMMPTANDGIPIEQRDVHVKISHPTSTSVSHSLETSLGRSSDYGVSHLVHSPSSTQRRTLSKSSQDMEYETLAAYFRSPSASRSPCTSPPKPANHLLVSCPAPKAHSGSPGRRRPEWKSQRSQRDLRSPYGVQPATPASPLTMDAGQNHIPRQTGTSPLNSTRTEPASDPGGYAGDPATHLAAFLGASPAPDPAADPSTEAGLSRSNSRGRAGNSPSNSANSAVKPSNQGGDSTNIFCDPDGDPDDPTDDETDNESDDLSTTSLDSEEELDELEVPPVFCRPLSNGPDLLCSNRHVAYPHPVSPVLGDSRQDTRFGKVRFTVFPANRWARDPRDRRKRLAAAREFLHRVEREKAMAARKSRGRVSQNRAKADG